MSVGIRALILLGHRIASIVEFLLTVWQWGALSIGELDGCRLPMARPEERHGGQVKGNTTTAMLIQKETREWNAKVGKDDRDRVRKG